MIYAKQSTATIVTVGPVLDADGVAVTDGVVGDFKIAKAGGAPAALNGSATLTHRHTGHYSLALTASDLGTIGHAEIVIDDTVNSCAPKEITVLHANVYDVWFGTVAPSTGTPLDAAGVRTAVGLGSANLDTQLGAIDTVVDSILVDTAEIGAAGAGLTALATQASVNTIDDFLDTEVAAIKAKTDLIPAGGFPTNFSLLAISGAGAVTDADSGGGSSLTAQEVWEYGTRTLSAGTNINGSTFTAIPWNAAWDAEVQSEVADALAVYDPPTNAEMEARTVATAVYATATNLATVDTVVDALAVELAKVPRSGSTFRYTNQDTAATADVTIGAAT